MKVGTIRNSKGLFFLTVIFSPMFLVALPELPEDIDTSEIEKAPVVQRPSFLALSSAPFNSASELHPFEEEDLDCCERWYVHGGESCCRALWVVLRCFGHCLSLGSASEESCGVCTGCDFAENSTRTRESKHKTSQGVDYGLSEVEYALESYV